MACPRLCAVDLADVCALPYTGCVACPLLIYAADPVDVCGLPYVEVVAHAILMAVALMTGTLPAAWDSLQELEDLAISANLYLSSELPVSWANMSKLQSLYLGQMSLTGANRLKCIAGKVFVNHALMEICSHV